MRKEFKLSEIKSYLIIGFYYNSNRKFRMETSSYYHASGINLWKGRMWGIKHDGKRVLLKTVCC